MGNSIRKTAKSIFSKVSKVGRSVFEGIKKVLPHVKNVVDRAKPLIAQMGGRGAAIAGGIESVESIGTEIQSTIGRGKKRKDEFVEKYSPMINKASNALNDLGLQKRPRIFSFLNIRK